MIFALIMTTAVGARGRELSYTLTLCPEAVDADRVSGVASVVVRDQGYRPLREEGRPTIPFRTVRILLPAGEEVAGFEFTAGGETTLLEDVVVPLAAGLVTENGVRGHPAPSFVQGSASGLFPAQVGSYLGTGYFRGYAIAGFAVYPLRIDHRSVILNQRIVLRVSTRPAADKGSIATRRRARRGVYDRTRATISALVLNPELMPVYHPPRISGQPSGGFRPAEAPSVEGSPVDYVVITDEASAAQYQRLADWKTSKGVPTVVRTTEWIGAHCRNGVDLAETIRFFIRDAYEKWGIEWVLLGGDTDVIPARYAYSLYLGAATLVPTDLYFACLDGSWNETHDQYWGQALTDDADLYADVFVGRLPSSSASDAATLIDKIVAYENPARRGFTDKVLLLAEVLFPADWRDGDPIVVDGAELSESLYVDSFANKPLRTTRAYETYTLYPGTVELTKQTAVDSMNAGANIVNHVGHGSRFNISCGDASLVTVDADVLTNQDRLFTLFMTDCYVSAFDYPCLAERFMLNPSGGAVATIGASHLEFPTVDAYYMNRFYELLFDQDVVRIGEAFAGSRLPQTPWALMGENVDRWTHYVYTLLADPELPVWTGVVDTVTVVHVDSVGLGTTAVSVEVSAGGQPVDSAVVCLLKGDEDYRYGLTGSGGTAAFDFTAESPGSISVVVTGLNLARHQSYITVDSSSAAYVSYAGVSVDDDTTGGSFGGGDGVIDAGETIDLTLALANTGESSTGSVSVTVRCAHPLVTVVDSVASAGVIGPGSTESALDPIRVELDRDMADETTVEFELSIEDDLSGSWSDTFRKLVHAPATALTTLRVDDSPPLGNGDGVVDAAEEFLLFYGIKNYGTGRAAGLTAGLTDVDGAFIFVDSTDTYPDLLPFATAENDSGLHMAETTTSSEHFIAVEINDLFGRTYADTIELRRPDPPGNLTFDASRGVDRVEVMWSKSAASDVATYNVYHSTTQGGPYQLATVDPAYHTVFMDVGLAPSTRYYYVATSIDESGNESAPSLEYSVSTNPPQLVGFPIEMSSSTSCPPAIGDIDGDGDKELVVGNRYVCAWHHDGLEIRDGDLDPQTWGILGTAGDNFVAPITLCRLDASPGLEIVAADQGTQSVYCMNGNGELLAGWPRVAENAIRAAPVAGDLDGDGLFEIVVADQGGVIYAWHADGNEYRDGDADSLTDGVFYRTPPASFHYQTPTVFDIDSDGEDEIIMGTRSDTVYALNGDGTSVPGWPYALPGEPAGSFAAADIDDDGLPELLCHTKTTHVYLLNHDGTVATGWPRWISINAPYFSPSPALADFDDDGKLEIVLVSYKATATKLYIVRHNGQDYPGWPVTFNVGVATECSPTVGDVDGDGVLDVVVGDESRFIYAFDIHGQMIDGFPVATGDAVRATPYMGDLDQDGDVELIAAGWDRSVYVWDLAGSYGADSFPWPTFHANVHRNGRGGFVVPTAADEPPTRTPGPGPRLLQNRPNPFNPSTTIVFYVPEGAPQGVSLRIYDVRGALVRTLADGELRPGRYDLRWDGRDDRGTPVATGLYFYELRERGFVSARKMLLLK